MIEGFREQIVSGETDFATLAARESHCSSAQRGGDLGEFGPGQMQAAFENVRARATTREPSLSSLPPVRTILQGVSQGVFFHADNRLCRLSDLLRCSFCKWSF